MAYFVKYRGKSKIELLPMTTGVAISEGSLVYWTSGRLAAATSTTAGNVIAGVIRKTITSASTEYSTNSDVPVEVPTDENTEWKFIGTSLSTSTIGTYLDLTNAYTVNGAASTYDIVLHTRYLSTTAGIGKLNIGTYAIAKA